MRSLMLKLLTTIIALSSLSLFAADVNAELDQKVTTFLQKAIAPNESYTFDKVVILKKRGDERSRWLDGLFCAY